jgi:glycosyltransferase involved in cell wall biosynthesis
MKKINLFCIFEDSRYGGPHAQFVNLFKSNKHFAIKTYISKKESSIFYKILKKNNIYTERVDIKPISKYWIYFFAYFSFFIRDIFLIKRLYKKNKSDLVYIPGGSSSFKSVIACLISNKKFIWHIHDCHSNAIFILIFSLFQKFAYKIIFASEVSKKFYTKYIKDDKKFYILQSATSKKKIKINNKKKFVVGILANFNPIKDIELFIKIANKMNNIEKKIDFLIVGNVWESQKKYFTHCIKLIKKLRLNNIRVILNKKNNFNFFNKVNIYLCTSKKESSPLSLWESMAAGIPVISTNVGDIDKYKKNTCFVINDKSENNFCKKIIKLFCNKELYTKLSLNSKKTHLKNFSIVKYKENFLKIFSH